MAASTVKDFAGSVSLGTENNIDLPHGQFRSPPPHSIQGTGLESRPRIFNIIMTTRFRACTPQNLTFKAEICPIT